jgi:hypothetical protein
MKRSAPSQSHPAKRSKTEASAPSGSRKRKAETDLHENERNVKRQLTIEDDDDGMDWRRNQRNVRTAELSGRELMFAETQVREWNWEEMMEKDLYELIDHLYLLIGKTRTGKTWWTRDFLYHMKDLFPYGWIFSHTKHNGFWQQYFPNHLIITEYDDALVQAIINMQQARIHIKGINPHIFLLFDDMASDFSIRYQSTFQRLAMEGRHSKITTIFLTQHLTSAATQIRTNASWVIAFTNTNETALKHLAEENANDFATAEDFRAFMDIHTTDRGVIHISQNPMWRGPERYWTYKSEEPPKNFILLCDKAWGGDRHKLVKKQRKVWKAIPDYSQAYLEKLTYAEKTNVTREQLLGTAEEAKAAKDTRPFDIIN